MIRPLRQSRNTGRYRSCNALRALCWALLISPAATAAEANTEENYANLPGYKALVEFQGKGSERYVVDHQPNKLAAASAALQACRTAHPQPHSADEYCELTRLGEATVTTAATLKQRQPRTRHPLYLWRYQQADATVYLAGSVHILKTGLYPLPAQYEEAFAMSDHLVLEVNLAKLPPEQRQLKSLQYGMLPDGQKISDVLPPDLYQQLNSTTRQYGLPLPQMERFKPSFITQQLTVLAMMALGYDPNQGVEKYFIDRAGERTILELETIDFQLGLLMNQPLDTQRAMVTDTLAQLPDIEALTTDLIAAWMSGDDDSFASAFAVQSGDSELSKAFMHQLMDERNAGMADSISGYLQQGGTYFVLIGTGHYVGDNNIISLLARRGISGERIYSDQSLITPVQPQ